MSDSAAGSAAAEAAATPGFDAWRRSLAQFTGLGLTDADKIAHDTDKERQRLEGDWNKCEKWKASLMESSESDADMALTQVLW